VLEPALIWANLGGKFSKTNGTGVFGDQAGTTGIGSDIWRYYLLSIRPENADTEFSWDKLQAANNGELADNIGNLCARGLKFAAQSFENKVPVRGPATEREEVRDWAAFPIFVRLALKRRADFSEGSK